MSESGVLIRCVAPRPEESADIERWLTRQLRSLAAEGALLYCPVTARPQPSWGGGGEQWIIEFAAPAATENTRRMSSLLADMRLLGLNPELFASISQAASPTARPAPV